MPKIFGHFISGGDLSYRGYNALVGVAVTYNCLNDPNANWFEQLGDAGIHFSEALLPKHTATKFRLVLNVARGFQAGWAFSTGSAILPRITTIGKLFNGLDVLPNHALNCLYLTYNTYFANSDPVPEDVLSTKSKTFLNQSTRVTRSMDRKDPGISTGVQLTERSEKELRYRPGS